MINSINSYLKEDDELTARRLKEQLQKDYPGIPDVSISTIKRYEIWTKCIYIMFFM